MPRLDGLRGHHRRVGQRTEPQNDIDKLPGPEHGVRIDTMFWFEQTKDGTTVSVEFEVGTGGLPPGLLSPLNWAIEGKVRDVLGHDLADLRRSLESHVS